MAFLNGDLKEDIYIRQPEEYIERGRAHLVCKLKKSFYGLKQSPRSWNYTWDIFLKEIGFAQENADPVCIWLQKKRCSY